MWVPPALAYLKQMNGLSGLHLERAAHPYFTENETWVGSIYLGSLYLGSLSIDAVAR